jgi:glycosyltransferase involved in cell wall biosynthesis
MSAGGTLVVGNFLSASSLNECLCEELARQLTSRGWTVVATSSRIRKLPRLCDMVLTALRARDRYSVACIDVFSGPSFVWAEAVCWTLRYLRKPYVLVLRGGSLPAFAKRWPRRVRSLLGSAATVIVPSGYLLERMRPYRDDLRLIPNPLHVQTYPFRIRQSPSPRLVWLRAFHRLYNPMMAPDVVAIVAETHPDIRLTMYGPDKGDGSLELVRSKALRLGLDGLIELPGAVPKCQVPAALSWGDIFLNTTDVDNTPVSVMEAMACGLCIVSTDAGGLRHLLEDGADALLVPCGDPHAMADAVHRILTEPGLAARLSASARRKAESLDWSLVLPKLDRELRTAAESAGTRVSHPVVRI